MIEPTPKPTGTRGLMRIVDNTDGDDKTVDLYLASSAPITVPQLPWSFTIDGVVSITRMFNFTSTTAWQHISKVYVGYASSFTFHIGNTGKVELGGPTDFTIELQNIIKPVNIKVGDVWKKAVPYVYDDGVWKPAAAMVFVNSQWTEVI